MPRFPGVNAMSRFNSRVTSAGLLSIALAGLTLSSAAFATQPVDHGAAAKKAAEGKCGEGKCGANGAKTAKTVAAVKTAEGKCGEGKCGDARFSQTDADHDGRVSRAEFLAVVPSADAFAQIDKDGNGYISEKEAYNNVKRAFASNGKSIPVGLFAKFGK